MEFDLNMSAHIGETSSVETGISSQKVAPTVDLSNLPTNLDELGKMLSVGASFSTLDEAVEVYERYATIAGFNVRKGTQAYFIGTKIPRMKVIVCSAEGNPDTKRWRDRIPLYRKQITRTKCQSRLRVCREFEGPWIVSLFCDDHNHELSPLSASHLLRSSRKLTPAKKHLIESFAASGIGVARACRYMEKECGGVSNLGFTRRDAYAHLYKSNRKTKIGNGDSCELLKFFIKRSVDEPFFYWNVQLDDEGRLMNFFYRDSRAAIDYDYFGDVVSVDTTFRTNKYDLICCPFVGINHHKSNILFGIALLSDETTSSFEWMFTTFAESMYGKEPGVIFTDQCQALMNVVDNTFTTASHRLCQWHINQNAPAHFGELNGSVDFKRMWFHCMNGCETVEEFDNCWYKMITEHGLEDKRWFSNMYELRTRWAGVFTNNKFTAGLHATSRSESANKAIKELCCHTTSLFDFVTKLSDRQDEWRNSEEESDALNRWRPGQIVKHNPLLAQAADIYTRNVFKLFENQVANSLNLRIVGGPVSTDATISYSLSTVGNITREVHVVVNETALEIQCSCRFWERNGVLCSHIVHIMLMRNMLQIPDKYIMRRWSKEAKNRINRGEDSEEGIGSCKIGSLYYVNRTMRILYELLLSVRNNGARSKLLSTRLATIVSEFQSTAADTNATHCETKETSASCDLGSKAKFKNPPPPTRRARGRRKNTSRPYTESGGRKGKIKRVSHRIGNSQPVLNGDFDDRFRESSEILANVGLGPKSRVEVFWDDDGTCFPSRPGDNDRTREAPIIATQSSQNFPLG